MINFFKGGEKILTKTDTKSEIEIKITDWLKLQNNLLSEETSKISGQLLRETEKAYFIKLDEKTKKAYDISIWIPKSQVIE